MQKAEDVDKGRIDMSLKTDPIVGNGVCMIITEVEEEIIITIIMTETTDLNIGLIVGLGIETMEMAIDEMIDIKIDQVIGEIISAKLMEIKGTEIGV